nr:MULTISPECIES: glycine cleavage system protein H [unclassified Thioalkalivibrio]
MIMSEYRGCEIPEDLYYDLDYLWAREEADGSFTLGLTDPAQTMAGRLQYTTFKRPGTHRRRGKTLARLESGKWAGGVPAPFDGTIEEVNAAVTAQPDLVNRAPYDEAWLLRLRPDDPETAREHLYTGERARESLEQWIERYGVQCMRCAD